MKMKIEKGKIARCPYCGRVINYFFLYDSKHYDFGHCSHCGGIYAVRYSGWTAVLTACTLMATAAGVLLHLLADGGLPSWKFFLLMAAVLIVIYLLIPMFILPTKCVVEGRLGGFPDRDSMPFTLRQRLSEDTPGDLADISGLQSDSLSDEAQKMFVPFSPDQYETPREDAEREAAAQKAYEQDIAVSEPTIVASEVVVGEQLSAQERYRRAQKTRSQARHAK